MSLDALLDLSFFFFNDTATTEIYTLSLHDALPIFAEDQSVGVVVITGAGRAFCAGGDLGVLGKGRQTGAAHELKPLLRDRKSTRLNSSHGYISYAVFCLKKKNKSAR